MYYIFIISLFIASFYYINWKLEFNWNSIDEILTKYAECIFWFTLDDLLLNKTVAEILVVDCLTTQEIYI